MSSRDESWKQGAVSGRDTGKLLLDLGSEIDKCVLWKQALESGGSTIKLLPLPC